MEQCVPSLANYADISQVDIQCTLMLTSKHIHVLF